MTGTIRKGILSLLCLGAVAGAFAADLKGHVTLVAPAADAGLTDTGDTVVFFTPDAKVRVKPLRATSVITMQGKSFAPHVLTITQGSTVRFANDDMILHNVFSTSPGNDFDMGFYGHGPGKTKTFERPGLVRVYCNVHHEMFAYILVLDTPYYTDVGDDGGFELRGLPAGPGEITVWNPRSTLWREHVDSAASAVVDLKLALSRFAIPAHFNKFGKPYDKGADPGY